MNDKKFKGKKKERKFKGKKKEKIKSNETKKMKVTLDGIELIE